MILNAPKVFESAMMEMTNFTEIHTEVAAEKYDFILAFAKIQIDLNAAIEAIEDHINEGDTIVWFAYPKKSSKLYKSDITRDSGWEYIGKLNVEPVRSVAIDTDWSTLRWRKVKFIKNLKRKFGAYSEEGKKRVKDN